MSSRITAIEPQARRQGRVNVFVDGRFALGLFEEVAAALGLAVGQEMSEERLRESARAETLRRAKEDAYRLLGFRARAEKELKSTEAASAPRPAVPRDDTAMKNPDSELYDPAPMPKPGR